MTVETLIKYLQCFDNELEVKVCKRTRAKLPLINPWYTEEVDVEVPLLCAPTAAIELVIRDRLTPNSPVLLVT